MNPERLIAYRKQAASLLEAVLSEEISSRTAINCWPVLGNEDVSVRTVYTMLWFFESDEDRHDEELYYSDLQLKILQEAHHYLNRGEPLPLSLIKEYRDVAAPPEHSSNWTWREPLWWCHSRLRAILLIIETHPLFHKIKGRKRAGKKHLQKQNPYSNHPFS